MLSRSQLVLETVEPERYLYTFARAGVGHLFGQAGAQPHDATLRDAA
jgi:hypothetical protein